MGVFVRIPRISSDEWHPFTISSAPEVQGHFTLHIRGVGHWTQKLYQLFEDEYKKQTEQSSQDSNRGGPSAVLNGLKATLKKNYHTWTESRREKKKGEQGESGLREFAEYIKEHEAEALKKRKEERMKKRESKLNQIKSELEGLQGKPESFRKHLTMRNAKSVRYKPERPGGRPADHP